MNMHNFWNQIKSLMLKCSEKWNEMLGQETSVERWSLFPSIPTWSQCIRASPDGIMLQLSHADEYLSSFLKFPEKEASKFPMTIHSRVSQIRLKKKFPLMFNLKHLFCDLSHCISASICSENRIWWLPLVLNQFSSVMSDSLQTHGLQHARPPCLPPIPGVYSNSCPLSQWCHSHLILCRPLLLLPSIFPSIRVFSNASALQTRWPKYWSFSFSISPSNEYSGLISFRMDWLDLLAVQGTLKSLLQHHSSKASILLHSAFFTVHLSHPYMTTGKNIALTRWTFVGKVMSAF